MAKERTEGSLPKKTDLFEERNAILGSDNVKTPLVRRVVTRLKELKRVGKVEFHKDENKEWQNIEPSMPIASSLELWTCVKRKSDEEYHITYDTFLVEEDKRTGEPRVVTVPVLAGPGNPNITQSGINRKIIEFRVTEVFKKGEFFTTSKKKMDDVNALRKDYEEKKAAFEDLRKSWRQ